MKAQPRPRPLPTDPYTRMWVERNSSSGKFERLKKTGGLFKGVKKEN